MSDETSRASRRAGRVCSRSHTRLRCLPRSPARPSLGIGGDNSRAAIGTFFEGCIAQGYSSDATDDALQADIIAAGYGL